MGAVGRDIKRLEGMAKVTGKVVYVHNMYGNNMLHIKLLRSVVPHGRIVSIDIQEALKVPGVVRILTGADVKELDINPYFGPAFRDQPIIAIDKVRYVGEPVVAVVAKDLQAAETAVNLIDVEYDEQKAVFDVLEAAKDDAPIINEKIEPAGNFADLKHLKPKEGSNVCLHFKLRHGAVEKGFKEADRVFENVFTTQVAVHLPMEPHVTIADVSPDGKIDIWTANQSPSYIRSEVAHVLKVPQQQIRVRVPHIGGGFGTKLYVKIEALVALIATIVQRQVRLSLTVDETFLTLTKHATVSRLRTGVTNDGRIVARSCEIYWDTGAYAEIGPRITQKSGFTAAGPYKIPNVSIDSYCVYTNKPPAGALRGFGVPQLVWAYESQMDIIAHEMGWDPVEFRYRQVLREGDEQATGQKMVAVGFDRILDGLKKSIDWKASDVFRKEDLQQQSQTKFRGKAISVGLKAVLTPSVSGAIVNMSADGSVTVSCSTVDMGQGSDTVLCQIASETLTVPMEKISIVHPDTDVTPFDTITAASRSTFYMGNAIHKAALKIVGEMLSLVAQNWGVDADSLEIRDEKVISKTDPNHSITFSNVISSLYHMPAGNMIGHFVYMPSHKSLDPETGQSEDAAAYWFAGGTAVEVEVDIETGKVRLLKLVCSADPGKAVNPLNVHQQLHGAGTMALGQALFEECHFDGGQIINGTMADYHIPSFNDLPQDFETQIVEVLHPEGPFGAKGVGETGSLSVAPAIANAVYNAIGVRIVDLPLTPEKIYQAIQKEKR